MTPKNLREAALRKGGWRLFRPILAGATFPDRLFACLGALAGIALVGAFCGFLLGAGPHAPLIVAPLGASAVLLFAVPSSPLAQPWSILGGNAVSALIGLLAARWIPDPTLAVALGVATAIGVMSLTRCLHPPGGAMALTAALGGPAVEAWGFWFPLVPVALNSALLVVCGLAFHRLLGHRYPATATPNPHLTADPPAWRRGGFQAADVDAALTALDESFDIDREDLTRLIKRIEREAARRLHGGLSCGEIMSRDVIRVREETDARAARDLLLKHNIRSLPVEDAEGRLVGTVGLRELADAEGAVGPLTARAITAFAQTPAMSLLSALTDGRTHAVIVTDSGRRILGVVSQTDLLGAAGGMLARSRS
ncbi:HPP family protein [Neomegalonema sp.]|uniref:HPP family protein n=1 Tax=Neomegalonema sp. TaxID=2039713 RepID=UPI00261798AB|nr:HPP family protein [Neomegalonema sp.]MDD2869327.1 HPP family protein [Neomegalonema sp.]